MNLPAYAAAVPVRIIAATNVTLPPPLQLSSPPPPNYRNRCLTFIVELCVYDFRCP